MRRLTKEEEGIFSYQTTRGKRFAVRFEYRGKDWRKFGFANITKARNWLQSRKGRAAEARLFPEQEHRARQTALAQKPLFQDYADVWLDGSKGRLKGSTHARYKIIYQTHLKPTFGPLRLHEIDRAKVRQWIGRLSVAPVGRRGQPLSSKTLLACLRTLSVIFSQANEDGLITHNHAQKPAKLIRREKETREPEVFTYEEQKLILQKAKELASPYYPFLLFLFRTGLRFGEACAIDRDKDLDLQARYVLVRRSFAGGRYFEETPKSGKGRSVDLTRDLVAVLKEHKALQEAEAALAGMKVPRWLFTSPEGGLIRTNNFRDRIWRPLLRKAEVRYRTIHAIRHTYATHLIMAGGNLVYVQRQLGHSSIKLTVDLYTHWIEAEKRTDSLEVDRLLEVGENEVGTLPVTPEQSERA